MINKLPVWNSYSQFAIFIILLALYVVTMPAGVALEDDGLFILSSFFNGVSHPPGYPLHSFLGFLFSHLPFGEEAFRIHLLSAILSALSCYIWGRVIYAETGNSWFAYLVFFSMGVSKGVWSQSIIAEVYTLNFFLFSISVLLAQSLKKQIADQEDIYTKNTGRTTFWFALFLGLGVSNHWPLFILASVGILFYLRKELGVLISHWAEGLTGGIIGLLPFVWLFINSNSDVFINFYGGMDGFSSFWSYISREQYNKDIDFNSIANILDKLNFVFYSLWQSVQQYGLVSMPILIFGFWKSRLFLGKQFWNLILVSFLFSAIVLALVLGYEFSADTKSFFTPFLVIPYAICGVYFSAGLLSLFKSLNKQFPRYISITAVLFLLVQALVVNTIYNNRHEYNWATEYAKNVLDLIEPDSTLIVHGDESTAAIGYLRYVKGYRKDVTLINDQGLVFGTRLFDPRKINAREKQKIFVEFIQSASKPVYSINRIKGMSYINRWLVFQYPNKLNTSTVQVDTSVLSSEFAKNVFSDVKLNDIRSEQHRDSLRVKTAYILIPVLCATENVAQKIETFEKLKIIVESLHGLSVVIDLIESNQCKNVIPNWNALLQGGWALFEKESVRWKKAEFLNVMASMKFREGYLNESIELYKQSLRIYNKKDNVANDKLKKLCKDIPEKIDCDNVWGIS